MISNLRGESFQTGNLRGDIFWPTNQPLLPWNRLYELVIWKSSTRNFPKICDYRGMQSLAEKQFNICSIWNRGFRFEPKNEQTNYFECRSRSSNGWFIYYNVHQYYNVKCLTLSAPSAFSRLKVTRPVVGISKFAIFHKMFNWGPPCSDILTYNSCFKNIFSLNLQEKTVFFSLNLQEKTADKSLNIWWNIWVWLVHGVGVQKLTLQLLRSKSINIIIS